MGFMGIMRLIGTMGIMSYPQKNSTIIWAVKMRRNMDNG